MKKLSDYKGEEAILLWGNLLDSFTAMLSDKEIAESFKTKKPILFTAKLMLKNKPRDVIQLLQTVDDSEVDGLNVLVRLISLLTEISKDPDLQDFFGLSAEENGMNGQMPTGSATESTEESETQDTSSNM